jgi:hypothetical protein
MSGRPARRWPVGCAALLTCAACVSPAGTTEVYEAKAALTAKDALSSARTADLAVQSFAHGKLTEAVLEVLLQESETAVGSVTSTFDSVQPPPTTAADALRDILDALLARADSEVRELRIAARRGQRGELSQQAGALSVTADRLERFAQEHSS